MWKFRSITLAASGTVLRRILRLGQSLAEEIELRLSSNVCHGCAGVGGVVASTLVLCLFCFRNFKARGLFCPRICSVFFRLKKIAQPKSWELCFIFLDFLRTSSPGGSLSDSSGGLLWRGEGGARIYRGFCNKDKVVRTSKVTIN